MPIKKLIKNLKESLIREKERKHTTQLGILWGSWKCKEIERRIGQLNRELVNRKSKTKTEEK
jgi:hypothetical protein